MILTKVMNDLQNNLRRMEKEETTLSSGKNIRRPSDDPTATAKSLKIRTDLAHNEQYRKNIEESITWMNITESALDDMTNILQRIRELTIQGANRTLTPEDSTAIAKEIEQLKSELINVGNTSYNGRYVFSGFKTSTPPFSQNDNNYYGDTNVINMELGMNNRIPINVTGDSLYKKVDGGGFDLLGRIDYIVDRLKAGDSQAVSASLGGLDFHIENVLAVRADVGARYNRLELTKSRLEDDNYSLTELMSKIEDADIAEVIMNLQNDENVYRASLATGARIIQPTLVDFLR